MTDFFQTLLFDVKNLLVSLSMPFFYKFHDIHEQCVYPRPYEKIIDFTRLPVQLYLENIK